MKRLKLFLLFCLFMFFYIGSPVHAQETEIISDDTTEEIQQLDSKNMDPDTTQEQPVEEDPLSETQADLTYQTDVQSAGWQAPRSTDQVAGTIGKAKRIEALKIYVASSLEGSVEYRTHVQNIGWTGWSRDGQLSGSSGKGLRLEAVQIRLTEKLAEMYVIQYRVHCQDYGWLGWAADGQYAGTQGYGKRMEAIQIRLVKRESAIPVSDRPIFYAPYIRYQTHVQTYGWQNPKIDGQMAGTTGKSKRLEAIRLNLVDPNLKGHIQYRTHVQSIGWQDWKQDGQLAGTTGKSKQVEAIQIRLDGQIAEDYDVYYRGHVKDYGWLEWTSNGMISGTTGCGKQMESLQIKLIKKTNAKLNGGNTVSYLNKNTGYYGNTIVTGWNKINQSFYYFDSKGNMVTRQVIDGYYLMANGKRLDLSGLKKQLQDYIHKHQLKGESWSFALLINQADSMMCSMNSHSMPAASVIKLFVMATVYDNYKPLCKKYGKSNIDNNLKSMITVSDNDAWGYLLRCLGGGKRSKGKTAVRKWCVDHGYSDTLRIETWKENNTTVNDVTHFLEALYQKKYAYSSQMISLLNHQTRTWKIPAGLPSSVRSGNKTGELDNVQNDAAIIYAPKKTYFLTIMSNKVKDGYHAIGMIRKMSSITYKYLQKRL